jgi:hypothetical protein
VGLFTKAELNKKNKGDLAKLAEDHGLELDEDATVADYRLALLDVEAPHEDDEVEESDEEEVEEADDEEEDDLELPEEDEVDEAPAAPAKKVTAKGKQTKYTEGGKAENGEALLGAKEVATQVGTDAKSLRQFFRSGKSSFTAVGAGGRYEFKASDVAKIKEEFDAWKAGKPGRGRGAGEGGGSTRSRGRAAGKPAEVIEEVEEIEELEDLEELDEDELELDE